ncbi:MAG TPA: NADPH:quinone oxidoreductase family protein [Solirubrobacteraceae bacterium]|jgi:NADPH2:quinone reductase|nr:NADPH:quinone oxidoreductase family protein [Solirubrobacteraceae bacterium]
MRAIQIREFGGPEVLEQVELPTPQPADTEVLIRVAKAGVNFADTHTRTNSYVQKATLPLVPGGEVAGVVEQAPDGAAVRVGQRVVALTGDGGYAEYATAPADRCYPIPDDLDDDTAVAVLIQGLTAWHLYRTAGRVAPGESVVVHSAAGGVGSLAVQLGHPLGAGRVIGTASSPDRRDLAVSLGADVAVDADPEGLTERLIEANGGREVDVVFDMAGGEAFERSYRALAHFGRIVVCGISTQQPNEIRTGSLLRHSRSVVGFYLFHCLERPGMVPDALADLFARAARKELRVLVGGTYALGDGAQAQIDLRSRRTSGKLLLDPALATGTAAGPSSASA